MSPKLIVIGAVIGGIDRGSAQTGHDVTVLEANAYPGGCAGTFYHQGYRFGAGATVAGGFHANGAHALLGEQLNITWPIRPSEPAWVVHLPGRCVEFSYDNLDVIAQFPHSQSFWNEQTAPADLLWALTAQGLPWPPGGRNELLQLLRVGLSRVPGIARLLPYIAATTQQRDQSRAESVGSGQYQAGIGCQQRAGGMGTRHAGTAHRRSG